MEGKTIIIETYQTMMEAMYAKDALEQNGISAFISDENMVQLYPMFSSPIGGVKLHIFEADKERVLEILADIK